MTSSSGGMLDTVTLVAMSRSGATLVLRDRMGRLWLYPPEGAGRPRVVEEERAAEVIARQGLDVVNRPFASWPELDAFRNKQAARWMPSAALDPDELDRHDVESLLAVVDRWRASGDVERARRLVIRLLRVPAVRSDEDLNERVVGWLDELESPRLDIRPEPSSPLQEAARERWRMARAA